MPRRAYAEALEALATALHCCALEMRGRVLLMPGPAGPPQRRLNFSRTAMPARVATPGRSAAH